MHQCEMEEELECLICTTWIDSEIACTRRASSIPSPDLVRLPCRCREGYYHRECLVECWKQRNPTRCPLCRTALLSIEGCMQNESFVAAVFDTLGSWVLDDERIPDDTTDGDSVGKVYRTSIPSLADSQKGDHASWIGHRDKYLLESMLWPAPNCECDLLTATVRDGRVDLLELAGSSRLGGACSLFKDEVALHIVVMIAFYYGLRTKRPAVLHPALATAELSALFGGCSWLDIAFDKVFRTPLGPVTSVCVSYLLESKADPFQPKDAENPSFCAYQCVPFLKALNAGPIHLRHVLFSTYKEYELDQGYTLRMNVEKTVRWPEDSRPIQIDLSPGKCPIPHLVLSAIRRMYRREHCRESREQEHHWDAEGWDELAHSVHYLILAGASVCEADDNGVTALMYAVEIGHTEVVKMLLFHGADPEKPNPLTSLLPIHEAARCGFTDIVRALICGVAERPLKNCKHSPHLGVNARPTLTPQLKAVDADGRTAIWHAASQGWVETLRCLLIFQYTAGAFREMRDQADSDGVTALQAAKLRVESGFVSHSAAECVWMLERDAVLLSWGWDSWDKVGGIGLILTFVEHQFVVSRVRRRRIWISEHDPVHTCARKNRGNILHGPTYTIQQVLPPI